MFTTLAIIILILIAVFRKMFIIVHGRHTALVERLGKFHAVLQPGLHFLIPIIDSVRYLQDMREQVLDVPSQSCITKDNIQVEVDGLVFLRVMDANKASYGVEDYGRAAVNLAQTTMRSEIGKLDLDDTFSERESLNDRIVTEIDKASEPWGVKVLRYEIRNINPSANVKDTLEKQMEAERQKRAEIIQTEGEKKARSNESEGEKQANIAISEGEKQKRINEAVGMAREIELVGDATARGLERIGAAIARPGGKEAVKLQLIEQYLHSFAEIVDKSRVIVAPGNFGAIAAIASQLSGHLGQTPQSQFPQSKHKA